MAETFPGNEPCLTEDELQELTAAWTATQPHLEALGNLIARGLDVDCDELHEVFLALADAFEQVERLVMRAKQLRTIGSDYAAEGDTA
jgi:hypothetical protein